MYNWAKPNKLIQFIIFINYGLKACLPTKTPPKMKIIV